MISREEALELLKKYVRDDKIIKHCIAVSAIMEGLAEKLGEDPELWSLIGLLHDIDYEITKRDLNKHGLEALKILEGKLPKKALEAIALHNEHNGYKPECEEAIRISRALRAADHLSGLIVATALVMPNKKISEIKVKSLKKKFKSKDFARGVDRDRIREIEEFGLSLSEFFEIGLESMKKVAGELGL